MLRRLTLALAVALAVFAVATPVAGVADPEVDAYWPKEHRGVSRAAETWSYDRLSDIGPSRWYLAQPVCGGQAQSPIDIQTRQVLYDPTLQPLSFNYVAADRTVVNDGHALKVNENTGVKTSTVSGGALGGYTYSFLQYHLHTPGEHTVNGGAYPMELHLVHSNLDTTQTTPTPTSRELTVVGLLFKEGAHNTNLESFITAISADGFDEEDSSATAHIDLNALLPTDRSYYTYQGSLTTPGCRETVTWHVMSQELELSPEQLGQLRKSEHVQNNNRPVQHLNGRLVRTNSPTLAGNPNGEQQVVDGPGQVVNINFANMLAGFTRN